MEEKKVIKLKLNIIIAILLIILIIASVMIFIIFSKKTEFSMSNNEIKKIANNNQYEIDDEPLKSFSNSLLKEGGGRMVVSKQSADLLEDAQKLSMEYKDNFISNTLNTKSYELYPNFEYIDLIETTYYYKFIGEYTYKYMRGSTLMEDRSYKYIFLVFKSDYFEYPYFKKHNTDISIKEFGDILSIISYGKNYRNRKLIKSEVKDNGESFTYNLYYISQAHHGPEPDSSGMAPAIVTGVTYSLDKATFTVNKLTGETDLDIKERYYYRI